MTLFDCLRWTVAATLAAGVLVLAGPAAAQWPGFSDESTALDTMRFPFFGSHPEAGTSNENYYDGDLGDFDGDRLPDRLLGSRYGLLFNTGDGWMEPVRRQVGLLLRGDPGASGWGEDAMGWVDIDGDGDLDAIAGGNGEPLTAQSNDGWRFRTVWVEGGRSALNIVTTDLERDGDVDLIVAHAFCARTSCGGPRNFDVLVNDGTGVFSDETAARGLSFSTSEYITGVVSGDVDRDGDFDLLIQWSDDSSDHLVVAFNDGTGHFTRTDTSIPSTCSGFGQGLNLGDIDDDGDLDIALARCGSGASGPVGHVIAVNDGAGSFSNESASRFDVGGMSGPFTGGNGKLVDLDHDGDLDFIALRTANFDLSIPDHWLQVYLNDGSGVFVYDDALSYTDSARGTALGADVDVSDLDGDGVYDLWLGFGGDRVRILRNLHVDPTGLGADVPRDVTAAAGSAGIEVSWDPPPFASNVRYYRVYRSTAPGLEEGDRPLLHTVSPSAFADQDFFVVVDRHTTTAELGDADVSIDASTGRITYTDRTAVPGVRYHYSVSHVGPESDESASSPEAAARIAPPGGSDTTAPELVVVSPEVDSWWRSPRVVLAYADGGSGVDPASVRVSFDADLGPVAAGTNVADMAYRRDDGALVAFFAPPHELPADTVVTLTAEVSDMAGNTAAEEVTFFVSTSSSVAGSPTAPSAALTASATSGEAPLDVAFDGSGSDDPDGQILRWEWYFGDGRTAMGREVTHTYWAGTHGVTLLVRDTHGNVATATTTIDVTGATMPPDAGAGDADGGVGPGTDGGVTPGADGATDDGDGGTTPADETMDGGCGCTVPGRGSAPAGWLALLLVVAPLLRRRARRWGQPPRPAG